MSDARRYVLHIDGWLPARVNELYDYHWTRRRKLKARDRDMVQVAVVNAKVPWATGKRRVSLTLTFPKGQRMGDIDAYFKSPLDALRHARAIVDDSPAHCELGPVIFNRGATRRTTIILEDVA